jgi:ABC-type antimicrobial peptide transport system permease subunit
VIIGSVILLALAASGDQPVVIPTVLPWLTLSEGPVVGLVATALPAIRAARLDPVAALAAP